MAVRHIFFAKADRGYLHELPAEASERFGTRMRGFCLMRDYMHPKCREIAGRGYPLSVPPVCLATLAIIFFATASISASVRVRSVGRSVTEMATDLRPSPTPSPA